MMTPVNMLPPAELQRVIDGLTSGAIRRLQPIWQPVAPQTVLLATHTVTSYVRQDTDAAKVLSRLTGPHSKFWKWAMTKADEQGISLREFNRQRVRNWRRQQRRRQRPA